MTDLTVRCCAGKSFPISLSSASDETTPTLSSFSAEDLVPALDERRLRTITLASCLLADIVLGRCVCSAENNDSSRWCKNANTSGRPDDLSAASVSSVSRHRMKHSVVSKLVPPPFCCDRSVPIDKADTTASLIVFFISFIAALTRAGKTILPNFA